ncbi:MAG TPA: aldo/keto reductase [Candidatus Sulfotelmatobacter sp.]|nr:aldo/keto reductase [Candidatus Sulfotelmatobacter sp.]
MKYRRLGGTDLDVSVICLGPMRAAATKPGADEKSRAGERALRRALEHGVNFVHSSYEYGTRWMMSRVLRDHPKRAELHHVIKVPVPDFTDGDRFDAAKFRLRIEEALRDLHAERIAVLQWMWRSDPNDDARRLPLLGRILDDVAAAFEKLRAEGKAGYLFTFPYTVPCAQAALATGRFGGLLAYYNLAEMEMADLFGDLERRRLGFIAIRPLYEGVLTDERAAPRAGDRVADPQYAPALSKRRKIVEAFRDEIGESLTSFALRCALAAPVVASLVVGLNRPEQVDGIVQAIEGPCPPPEMVRRAQALWRAGL